MVELVTLPDDPASLGHCGAGVAPVGRLSTRRGSARLTGTSPACAGMSAAAWLGRHSTPLGKQRQPSRHGAKAVQHPPPRIGGVLQDSALSFYDVLDDPADPAFLGLGRLLWSLVATQWAWIDRRVETVTLSSERRFRRHMSIDCRVPAPVTDLALELGLDHFPVPLRSVTRRSLLVFDLRLDDLPVPLLTRRHNIMATQALLMAAVEPLGVEPDRDLSVALARVADADTRYADSALQSLGLTQRLEAIDETTSPEGWARWAITTFDRNHLLMADVPLEKVRQRAVFKITQELAHESPDPLPLRAELAWHATSAGFDTPDVIATASYHFQFVAPDGLMVVGGRLLGVHDGGREDTPFGTTAQWGSVLGLNAHASDVPEADTYEAVVSLRPSPEGLLRASAASAVVSTLVLFMATAAAHRVDDTQVGPSTALLLALPGLVSTFLARPGEHSLVSRLLRGVRVVTAASALTVYAAAGVLAVGVAGGVLRATWLALALFSAVPAVALVVAVWSCRPSRWT